MKFGCHVSIKNGYLAAAKHALAIGAKSYQYFPKNPRGLSLKSFDKKDANHCQKFCLENQLVSVSHSPYPTDLAASKEKRQHVIDSLLNDLEITEACGSIGVVVHFAKASVTGNVLEQYKTMIETINQVLDKWEGHCQLLIENNASKVGSFGIALEEFVKIRELCEKQTGIGYCFDTCHAYASGLWHGDNWLELLQKGKKLGYFEHLKVIHFNNSKFQMGLGKDRHANIFHHGMITPEEFHDIIATPELKSIPFILETPSKEGITYQEELLELNNRWGAW